MLYVLAPRGSYHIAGCCLYCRPVVSDLFPRQGIMSYRPIMGLVPRGPSFAHSSSPLPAFLLLLLPAAFSPLLYYEGAGFVYYNNRRSESNAYIIISIRVSAAAAASSAQCIVVHSICVYVVCSMMCVCLSAGILRVAWLYRASAIIRV